MESIMKNKIIIWYGRLFSKNGYSVVTRNYIECLKSISANFCAIDSESKEVFFYGEKTRENFKKISHNTKDRYVDIVSNNKNIELVFISHEVPENFPKIKSNVHYKSLFYVVAEVSPVPDTWVEIINRECSELLTSSTYCKDIFLNSGINVPIKIIPHSIDIKSFSNYKKNVTFSFYDIAQEESKNLVNSKFKEKFFLSVISNFNRKDPALLIQSYLNSKIGLEGHSLIIKLPYPISQSALEGHFYCRFGGKEAFKKVCKGNNIYILSSSLTDSQMHSMLNFSDFFFSVERAKGWDMNAMEALALGIPTISVDYSASQEFLNTENSLLIPSHGTILADMSLYGNSILYAGRRWANTRSYDIENCLKEAASMSEDKYLSMSLQSFKKACLYDNPIVGKHIYSIAFPN